MKKRSLLALTTLLCTSAMHSMSKKELAFFLEELDKPEVKPTREFAICINAQSKPDTITIKFLDDLYENEKNMLSNQQLLIIRCRIGFMSTLLKPSKTASALLHAVVGYLQQLDVNPNATHGMIINKIAALCSCKYFDMTSPNIQSSIVSHLTQTAQQYPIIIRQNSTLDTIITEFTHNT